MTADRKTQEQQCDCFGDSGLHASTHVDQNDIERCDLCGRPIRDGSVDVLTALNRESDP